MRYSYETETVEVCVSVRGPMGNYASHSYLFNLGTTLVIDARDRTTIYNYEKSKITRINNSNDLR